LKKYISAFVAGFGAGVLQVIPVAKSFSCCLIIPAAAFIALFLDQKANKDTSQIDFSKAAIFGLLTGLWAAVFGTTFDLLITFITRSNDIVSGYGQLQTVLNNLPFDDTLKKDISLLTNQIVEDIQSTGFSILYSFSVIVNNLFINTVFGFIGGLIGMQILNSRNTNDTDIS